MFHDLTNRGPEPELGRGGGPRRSGGGAETRSQSGASPAKPPPGRATSRYRLRRFAHAVGSRSHGKHDQRLHRGSHAPGARSCMRWSDPTAGCPWRLLPPLRHRLPPRACLRALPDAAHGPRPAPTAPMAGPDRTRHPPAADRGTTARAGRERQPGLPTPWPTSPTSKPRSSASRPTAGAAHRPRCG
jgi:hypothetical protein